MNRKHKLYASMVALALFVLSATTLWGQGRGQTARAPLQVLKQELAKAGAAALDSNQELALHSAIANFREANRPTAPDSADKTAREDYSNAILAGNNDAAKAAADKLADVLSMRQQERLEAEAAFSIQMLSILRNDQIAALQISVGKEGLLRMVTSMSGPGGGFGRGMMGRGAMLTRPAGNPN